MVHTLAVLAAEGGPKTLWDPTILGVLTVLSAVGLFCGSVYLLLSTNLGARLGFLVAGACLTGFLVLLSGLWITTATPLNSPKGRPAAWKTVAVVDSPKDSKIDAVKTIASKGKKQTIDDLAQLRPAVEGALVKKNTPANQEAPSQPLATFAVSTNLLTDFDGFQTYVVGGETKNLLWHKNKYAAVEFCSKLQVEVAPGEKPPLPVCDPLVAKKYAILQRDYGSIRQPPWVYFGFSVVLFGLFLLGLHWYELDSREREKAAASSLRPVPTA
jgi:hypothetical protein